MSGGHFLPEEPKHRKDTPREFFQKQDLWLNISQGLFLGSSLSYHYPSFTWSLLRETWSWQQKSLSHRLRDPLDQDTGGPLHRTPWPAYPYVSAPGNPELLAGPPPSVCKGEGWLSPLSLFPLSQKHGGGPPTYGSQQSMGP